MTVCTYGFGHLSLSVRYLLLRAESAGEEFNPCYLHALVPLNAGQAKFVFKRRYPLEDRWHGYS